jgi:hypothetical protein
VGSAVLALIGVWLLVAPAWLGDQVAGSPWTAATRNDVVVGAVLLGVSLVGLFAQVAFALRDLTAVRPGRGAAPESEGTE